jgi:hypothetical protein
MKKKTWVMAAGLLPAAAGRGVTWDGAVTGKERLREAVETARSLTGNLEELSRSLEALARVLRVLDRRL